MVTLPDTWTPITVHTNHVLDPSFEATSPPLNGWSSAKPYYDKTNVLQSFDQYGTEARVGSKSLRMVCGTSGTTVSNWVSLDNVFATGRIVIYVKTTAASPKQVGVVIKPIQADGTVVPAAVMQAAYGYTNSNVGNTWIKVSIAKPTWTTTTYPTMTGLRMYLTAGGPYAGINAGDVILWDTFSDTGTSDYFDGSSSDNEFTYAWSGAANASTSTRTTRRQVHYPSAITLGTPFTVQGTGYPAGTAITVTEGTWGEITGTTVADSSGNWTVTMTVPANTNPEIGPVATASDGYMLVTPTVDGVSGTNIYTNLPTRMAYLDPTTSSLNAQVFVGGTAKTVAEMRAVRPGGALTNVTELGT